MKKMISLLLAILMLASLTTGLTAYAAEASGNLTDSLTWSYDESTKTLTVSGTGDIPWLCGDEPWKDFREDVETLILGEGVTGIGKGNFNGMEKLKRLTLPSTLEVIGMDAFHGCRSLQNFAMPASVSRIDQAAFQNCESLTAVWLPDQMTVLHGAVFAHCSALRDVHLPANLTKIYSSAFTCCTSLTEIDIPNGVTAIPFGMFYGCTSLKTVSLPRNLKSIGERAFKESGIEELWIPATVEEIYQDGYSGSGSFDSCSNLRALYFLGDAPAGTIKCFSDCAATLTLYHTADSNGWDSTQLTGKSWDGKRSVVEQAAVYTHTVLNDCCGEASENWTCTETGAELVRSTAGLKHEWGYTLNAAPVDGEDGKWKRTCAVCGKSETVAIPNLTVEAVPACTNNRDKQTYVTYGSTVKSYLVPQDNGDLLRVEALSNGVVAERYDSEGGLIFKKQIPMELPIFGGFYAGENYNFFVFGQMNPGERDDTEVIRIVRYTKGMFRCGEVSIFGANTRIPFSSGSLRMAEAGDTLFIHTCHQMFKNSDGYVDNQNHQANLVISVDTEAMRVNECFSRISGSHCGYISHSFNQFIAIDGEEIYTLNQGDSNTRGAIISHYPMAASSGRFHNWNEDIFMLYHNAFPFAGQADGTHYNVTGATLGGFVISDDCFVIAGSSSREETVRANDQQNIFLTFTQKNVFDAPKEDVDKFGKITGNYTRTVWLTDFASDGNVKVSTPQLVRIDGSKLLVLWTEDASLRWTVFDGNGSRLTEIFKRENAMLSDCVPIQTGSDVVWYVADNGSPVFYRLSVEDLQTLTVIDTSSQSQPDPQPEPPVTFHDVEEGTWYYDAVLWAAEHNITAGTSEHTFSPNATCTRAQIVTFLWRANGSPEPTGSSNPFRDVDSGAYYYKAVLWAVEHGITAGTSATTFSPNQPCTRGEAVMFLYRTFAQPGGEGSTPFRFTDVQETDYYYAAVHWALENHITAGTSATTFSPNAPCTRAQIVTFLYRCVGK